MTLPTVTAARWRHIGEFGWGEVSFGITLIALNSGGAGVRAQRLVRRTRLIENKNIDQSTGLNDIVHELLALHRSH